MDDTLTTDDLLAEFSPDRQARAVAHDLALEHVDLSTWFDSGECAWSEWSEAVEWIAAPTKAAAAEAVEA